MNALVKGIYDNLRAEIENIKFCADSGDKDGLKRSLDYAKRDIQTIDNIARNLAPEELVK